MFLFLFLFFFVKNSYPLYYFVIFHYLQCRDNTNRQRPTWPHEAQLENYKEKKNLYNGQYCGSLTFERDQSHDPVESESRFYEPIRRRHVPVPHPPSWHRFVAYDNVILRWLGDWIHVVSALDCPFSCALYAPAAILGSCPIQFFGFRVGVYAHEVCCWIYIYNII